MIFYLSKLLLTSAVIVLVTEVVKRSDKFGALIAALPLTTLLIICWMYAENQPDKKIADHMVLTFYFVLRTLPMFLLFPYLISKFGFLGALAAGILLSIALIYLFNLGYQKFGFHIL